MSNRMWLGFVRRLSLDTTNRFSTWTSEWGPGEPVMMNTSIFVKNGEFHGEYNKDGSCAIAKQGYSVIKVICAGISAHAVCEVMALD